MIKEEVLNSFISEYEDDVDTDDAGTEGDDMEDVDGDDDMGGDDTEEM